MSSKNTHIALYVHWPFCLSKCPYCDFNSHVRKQIDHARWKKAMLQEMEMAHRLCSNYQVSSIFFGGGTPSLCEPDTIGAIINHAKKLWPTDGDITITLEANPNSSESARFKHFAGNGINRISIGVQSLRNDVLQFLGRAHDRTQAIKAVEAAQSAIDNVSIDLIYAHPNHDIKSWQKELNQALKLNTKHLSAYQLTFEPNTAFATALRQGKITPLNSQRCSDLFLHTLSQLQTHGLKAYELSNFSYPNFECKHNLTYWRNGNYLGIGPGSHSRLDYKNQDSDHPMRSVYVRPRLPEKWLKDVEQKQAWQVAEQLSHHDIAKETIIMGLRLQEKLHEKHLYQKTGMNFSQVLNQDFLRIAHEYNWIIAKTDSIQMLPAGWIRLDALLERLIKI